MKFVDNANLTTFLLGAPIEFRMIQDDGQEQILYLRTPSICELYTNTNLQIMLGILNSDEAKLNASFGAIQNLTHYNLLIMLRLNSKHPVYQRYYDVFVQGFKILGLDLRVEGTTLKVEQTTLNEESYNALRKLILIMTKVRSKGDLLLETDEKYRASQDVIARIKKQGNKQSTSDGDKNFEKNFITLLYEFGLSIEEIKQLNIYQYEIILSYTGNSINYKISTIAAGNGLSKKVKFITQGGKK